MSDKISVNPDSIRGLGDIVSPKTVSDFDVFNVKLTTASAVIDAETLPVFNHNYLPGSKLQEVDYLLCIPSDTTTATVSFKLEYMTGAIINGASVSVSVNDTVVGSCTTDISGIGSYTIDLTGAFLETSLFYVKLSYEGNVNVSGCFKNIVFWHGDITGLTLTSDASVVDDEHVSHVLATLSGTNMLGESVGIPGQEVQIFEEYTPGLKLICSQPTVSKEELVNITAQIIDTEDGSRVSLPDQLIYLYEEYTPGITVRPSKAIMSNGETITITGQLIDTTDGSLVALENQTVKIYEEYTPGVRITGPKITSDGADDIILTAELYDTSDGSRVCLAGETIDIYEDFHPNIAVTSNHAVIETGDTATLTATLLDDDGSAISGETINIYEEYTPSVMVSSNYKIIETGDTATLTAQLIDAEDGSRVSLSGETITIYQEVDEIFYYCTLTHETSGNLEFVVATVTNQFGDEMEDVLVELHSSWTGRYSSLRTNSSGKVATRVYMPIYDNYWFATLPDIYGNTVVADIDLRDS